MLAAVYFIFIITYHIIAYMFGGVIRYKIQQSVNILTGWITRSCNIPKRQQFELHNVLHDKIPEVTYNYCEFRELLMGQD